MFRCHVRRSQPTRNDAKIDDQLFDAALHSAFLREMQFITDNFIGLRDDESCVSTKAARHQPDLAADPDGFDQASQGWLLIDGSRDVLGQCHNAVLR